MFTKDKLWLTLITLCTCTQSDILFSHIALPLQATALLRIAGGKQIWHGEQRHDVHATPLTVRRIAILKTVAAVHTDVRRKAPHIRSMRRQAGLASLMRTHRFPRWCYHQLTDTLLARLHRSRTTVRRECVVNVWPTSDNNTFTNDTIFPILSTHE